jgi:hypothetical protein
MNIDLKKTVLLSKEELAQNVNEVTSLDEQESLNVIETLFKVLEMTLARGESILINDMSLVSAIQEPEEPSQQTAEVVPFPVKRDLN